ncbi:MAG: DUF222 domain-containing protein [Actinomycetes bacterium]
MFDSGAIAALTATAVCVDAAGGADTELLDCAVALEGLRRSVEAALGQVLGELDARGTTDAVTGHRTARWFSLATGASPVDASRRVRCGRRLRDLPVVEAALTSGQISWEHARVLADLAIPRNAATVAGAQHEFLALAEVLPFDRWRAEVTGLVDLADADGGHAGSPARGHLRMHHGFAGALDLAGSLSAEQGCTVRHALDSTADQLFRRHQNDADVLGVDPNHSRAELLADALVEICRLAMGGQQRGSTPATELTLIARAERPASPIQSGASDPVTLADGTVRTLVCDPVIRPIVTDSLGNPVDLGRRTRLVPDRLRKALHLRDGGCVFPGCDAPPEWCDLHHVVHWADGGSTSAENLAALCRHHHGVTHRTGWSMRSTRAQTFEWTRPDGRVLRSQRHRTTVRHE